MLWCKISSLFVGLKKCPMGMSKLGVGSDEGAGSFCLPESAGRSVREAKLRASGHTSIYSSVWPDLLLQLVKRIQVLYASLLDFTSVTCWSSSRQCFGLSRSLRISFLLKMHTVCTCCFCCCSALLYTSVSLHANLDYLGSYQSTQVILLRRFMRT